MTLRRFTPKQRNMLLQTLRYALNVRADHALPKMFLLPVAVALRPGSWDELATRFDLSSDKTDPRRMAFENARALYVRSRQYGYALVTCERLFSIDMVPDAPPDDADRDHGRDLAGLPVPSRSHRSPGKPAKAEPGNAGAASEPARMDRPNTSPPPREGGPPGTPPVAQAPVAQAHAKPKRPVRTPLERRMFHPNQRKDILKLFCRAFDLDAEAGLPAFLKEEIAIPLRIGCARDLEQRYNVPTRPKNDFRRIAFVRAMSRYAKSRAYQHAILTCETRFTIDMEPAEPITEKSRQFAISTLQELNKRQRKQEERARIQNAEALQDAASHLPLQPAADDTDRQGKQPKDAE